MPTCPQQVERPLARRPRPTARVQLISTSSTCCSIVCSGLSDVIGSWKIMEILLPLILRNAPCGSDSRFAPLNRILPEGCEAEG